MHLSKRKNVYKGDGTRSSKPKADKQDDKKGKVKDENGIPYNYIIIIDAGSKGSRAYVYNWPSTQYMLSNGILKTPDIELVKRVETSTDFGRLPTVHTGKKWYKKIKPGISAFNENSSNIGPNYLNHLLKKLYKVIPVEQHYRTPIFLHATAGMRLLNPTQQTDILNNICLYLQKQTFFYLPDCESHINTIDGDVEGLYAFIALNYLTGTLTKNTDDAVGLLDLGGASTQISFQPNHVETEEHLNQLVKLQLNTLGSKTPDLNFNVYSISFLGYGLTQIHLRYLESLLKATDTGDTKLTDPCLPTGYDKTVILGEIEHQISGSGDYQKCNDFIYPLIIKDLKECNVDTQKDVSSCLLTDSVPSFDFLSENFYGVSGYWDTISKLLKLDKDRDEKYGKIYSYDEIEKETKKICSLKSNELTSYKDLSEDELADLCFKSTYLLNLLHNGLGLTKTQHTNFTINDKINGEEFSWTLGRAVLYASDESAIEYHDYLHNLNAKEYPKVGYYRNSAPGLFIRGSEIDGIPLRPTFEIFDTYEEPGFLNFKSQDDDQGDLYVVEKVDKMPVYKKHPVIFELMIVIIVLLLIFNRYKLLRFLNEFFLFFKSLFERFILKNKPVSSTKIHWPLINNRRTRYKRLRSMDIEQDGTELGNISSGIANSSSFVQPETIIEEEDEDDHNQSSEVAVDDIRINDVVDNAELDLEEFDMSDDDSDDGIERVRPDPEDDGD